MTFWYLLHMQDKPAHMCVSTEHAACIHKLSFKAPIMTAADNNFCDIFPNFQQK